MKTIRLIRPIDRPGRAGPRNGQWALQRALRERAAPWLRIGGELTDGEIPWVWSYLDAPIAVAAAAAGRPFVVGPNVLFHQSWAPNALSHERAICRAASCRLIFTESEWYRDLIRECLGPHNRAPIVVWTYPIAPKPGGPLPVERDLLIYAKSGYLDETVVALRDRWPRSSVVRYGSYERSELFRAARTSRACAYLSDDDRGPLALIEILLAGCPVVGVPRGGPFVTSGVTGYLVAELTAESLVAGVTLCHQLDRHQVADRAAAEFATERTVGTVLAALETVCTDCRDG